MYEKRIKMSRNNNYTTWNKLNYSCHQIYYKPVGIDLSKQTNTSIPQQTNFTTKLEEEDGLTIFFIAEKQRKIILIIFLDSLSVTE